MNDLISKKELIKEIFFVKHGYWITHNEGNPFEIYGECSICGCSQSISDHLNYCPDCGAKMDGSGDEWNEGYNTAENILTWIEENQ